MNRAGARPTTNRNAPTARPTSATAVRSAKANWRHVPASLLVTERNRPQPCVDPRLAEAHPLADVGHRFSSPRAEAFGPGFQDRGDPVRVRHEIHVSLASRRVVLDDPIGEQLLRIDAAGPGGPLAVP